MFLERRSYRQRRVIDAARLLPVLGAVLFGLPLLWPRGAEDAVRTSSSILYVFGVWLILVCLAFVISRKVEDEGDGSTDTNDEGRP
ncbi:hypothetical protein M8756_02430 [Lutimaribacter sp. EGI FJ00015]|nr:hypothetical protein [Lutimaribacter sp. EGI FJ00015]MCO0634729.1 hypothetical protein [Lutimaribacter sp. EGI FJ00014]